uniref:aspartyl aminopeptidase n=1 Tax=Chromera velia CCMP2878 TaxID=1169474 RepID=A0A0G4GI45_9ALVE|eukprot:Cvel_21987.t1-p1 / transcript=Cvel_21987.t1 / gene=Cvel_21987 / organism=Chromera_velia_CCMP2878 / gene_product=Aspartyl aminopeptidase, putative / transcript_product=Aspartyl aminopeptidase, putative / location=Cvel_scaffold2117:11901-17345(+) / protein_length=524 / sequence_SO=supercontig / SO=protein_coding / is_pseudo=false
MAHRLWHLLCVLTIFLPHVRSLQLPLLSSSNPNAGSGSQGTMSKLQAAEKFLKFINKTGSPFHSVAAVKELLAAAKYTQLYEGEKWTLKKGGKYFVTRNDASICAFQVGSEFNPDSDKSGICIVAAHTDSPCLKVRPNSSQTNAGFLQLGVETYGGGLWHTWFDRGLGVAGKVVVRSAEGGLEEKLVRVERPLCIVPNLAIHLTTAEERGAFKYNKETHLQPVLCSQIEEELLTSGGGDGGAEEGGEKPKEKEKEKGKERHPAPLLRVLAEECGCSPEDVVDVDLCLFDATPGRVCGVHSEFIECGRLDNLVCTWAAFSALTEAQGAATDLHVAVAFDHEEVGSESYTGADGNALEDWLRRAVAGVGGEACGGESVFSPLVSRSFLISADMAHGWHPNYQERHQAQHRVALHKGVVIKTNSNQRYTSHALTAALLRSVALSVSPAVPIQDFVVKNDSPCGSTIGPMASSKLGMRSIDVGVCQWGMHSCREVCGVTDIFRLEDLCKAFFQNFRKVDGKAKTLDQK